MRLYSFSRLYVQLYRNGSTASLSFRTARNVSVESRCAPSCFSPATKSATIVVRPHLACNEEKPSDEHLWPCAVPNRALCALARTHCGCCSSNPSPDPPSKEEAVREITSSDKLHAGDSASKLHHPSLEASAGLGARLARFHPRAEVDNGDFLFWLSTAEPVTLSTVWP